MLDNICQAPYTGFVIAPNGKIHFCCMTNGENTDPFIVGDLNEIDDLEEFFVNSKKLNDVRTQFQNGNFASITPCSICYEQEKYKKSLRQVSYNQLFPNFISSPQKIKYLEYTTSNLCNATCATCSSFYSSSWAKYENNFFRKIHPTQKISNQSIEKIEKILPGLEYLMIKGGEPFIDSNNWKILKKIFECNKNCNVSIVTNLSILTDEHIEVLKLNANKIKILASIDGIHEVYNWIRSTDFDVVTKNAERLYNELGIKITIPISVSIFNFFILDDMFEYFSDKKYVSYINFDNYVGNPFQCSIDMIPKEIFDMQKNKILTTKFLYDDCVIFNDIPYNQNKNNNAEDQKKQQVFEFIEKINQMRGFDLCDFVPELKAWRG